MDILKRALSEGIISFDTIRAAIEMADNNKYLQMHKRAVWEARGYWYTELPYEPKRKQIKRRKKEDLEREIVKFYRERYPCDTFTTCFEKWTAHKLEFQEIGKGTFDRYHTEFKRFFGNTAIIDQDIETITEQDLEALVRANIKDLKLTAKAYANMRTLIIGTFKWARKQGLTEVNITSFFGDLDISRKMFYKPQKKNQVFREDEIPLLIKWLQEHPSVENYGLILTFQTGIREGELSALKYSDVNGHKLYISRQEIKYKGDKSKGEKAMIHEIVEYTKTDAGMREIIITDSALETIQRIKELNPNGEYMMMVGNRKIWTNTFNDRLYKACDGCGIERRSMHKIRKTYGTTLIDANVDDALVMKQMGHADIATTRKYYYFSNKKDENNVAQITNAINF